MTARVVRVSGLELQLRRTGRGRFEISYRGRVLGEVEEDRSVHVASSGGPRVRPSPAKPAPPNARHARRNGGPRRRRSRPYGWTCWRGRPSWVTCTVAYGRTLVEATRDLHGGATPPTSLPIDAPAPRRAFFGLERWTPAQQGERVDLGSLFCEHVTRLRARENKS